MNLKGKWKGMAVVLLVVVGGYEVPTPGRQMKKGVPFYCGVDHGEVDPVGNVEIKCLLVDHPSSYDEDLIFTYTGFEGISKRMNDFSIR